MTLTSNNERITNVELTNNMTHLYYEIDGRPVEVDGEFNFISKDGEYVGLREVAVVRDARCYDADGTLNEMTEELDNAGIIEEVEFEAMF